MSDTNTTFAFEQQDELPDDVAGDSRKPLLAVGGAVAALVLGFGAFVLLGGDAEEPDFSVAPRSAPLVAAPVEPVPLAVVPAASTGVVGRNPFKARYVEPKAAPAAEAPAETPATTAPLPTFAPLPLQPAQQPVLVVQQPAPAPAPSRAPAPAEYPITLTAVEPTGPSGITYTWTVEGKDVDVFQAQRFGRYGELTVLALETGADGVVKAVLQVGDASPIRVAVGETVNVL